jgi:hypothetical protein
MGMMTPIRTETMTETATMLAAAVDAEGKIGFGNAPLNLRRKHDPPPARWRSALSRSVLLKLLLCLSMAAQSQPIDPHALFEAKCVRCHDHAGVFARETLTIEAGEVVGRRSGKPVLKTLAGHFGKLSEAEAGLIVDMFRRQILSDGLYKAKCRFCHDPAKKLARQTLILREGQLVGRYSGRSIEDLLSYHGRLKGHEQKTVLDMLIWQLAIISSDARSN